jgi:uncharacterized SAM-binding protein YcdF (DUF218 family)
MILERNSKTTREAAKAVADILSQLQARDIVLVTSAAHMPRALASFRRQSIDPCPWPTDRQTLQISFPGMLLPQISSLQKTTYALHEYAGIVLYEVLGPG